MDMSLDRHELRLQDVAVHIRGRLIVKGLNLTAASGEIIGLMGPNGAGKSTAFGAIVGLHRLSGGRIELDGADISHMPFEQRSSSGLAYLPQESSVFRKMSVGDNILAALEMGRRNREQRLQQLQHLLEQFHLSAIRSRKADNLSGGERRRLEIARALATDPAFFLLDEPFAGIDPISITELRSLLQKLRDNGIGLIITDHNIREVLPMCDRAYIIHDGALIAHGSPQSILDSQLVQSVYLGMGFST